MIWNTRWFPGTNLQDLNLDWILKKISALRGGATGQYLYKKSEKDFDFGWKTGGGGGEPGPAGTTFTPSVSSAGVISWTNDGDLPNPEPVNIMGPQGAQGPMGISSPAYNRTNTNLVCFGDSWTVGTGLVVADRPTKRFTAIVAKKLNCTEFNFGVGASGFIRTGNLISTQITTADSQMTAEQKENTGVVLIVGGVNDYRQQLTTSTVSDFITGVISTATLAHTTFPNAVIVIGIGNTNLSYFPTGAKEWYKKAINACESQLAFPCVVIKNLYNAINGDSELYASDNLHPNESGHSAFGGYIANSILGGGQTVSRFMGNVSVVSPAVVYSDLTLPIYRINDEIVIDQRGFNFNPAVTENTVIGSIPASIAPPANSYYPYYRGNMIVASVCITSNGSVRLIPVSGASVTSGFSSQIRYLFGRETNTDES